MADDEDDTRGGRASQAGRQGGELLLRLGANVAELNANSTSVASVTSSWSPLRTTVAEPSPAMSGACVVVVAAGGADVVVVV